MKSQKLLITVVGLLVLALALGGCAKGEGESSQKSVVDESYVTASPSAPELEVRQDNLAETVDGDTVGGGGTGTATDAGTLSTSALNSRKVIFTFDYQLEATDMSKTLSALESAVQANGGFIESADYSDRDSNDQFTYATLTCRIPSKAAGTFKKAVEEAAHVRAKSEQGRDITEEYFDTETRLSVLKAQETRLLELLSKSGNLSGLLEVERELARVRTDIERLTGSLKKLDDLVDLTTFSISVNKVDDYSPPSEEKFLDRISRSTRSSFKSALEVVQTLLVILVYMLPYLLVIGATVAIVIWIVRKRKAQPSESADGSQG